MGRPITPEEFWTKVDKTPGPGKCWPWKGSKDTKGYGITRVKQKFKKAHRMAYFHHHGTLPDLFICHSCDNPICCNPEHLFAGTIEQNTADMISKNRQHKGPLSPESLARKSRGASHYATNLTDEIVMEIRRLYSESKTPIPKLAEQFGISKGAMSKICYGSTWKHLPCPEINKSIPRHSKISVETVQEIRRMRDSKIHTVKEIAEHFGLKLSTVVDIVYGRTWKSC